MAKTYTAQKSIYTDKIIIVADTRRRKFHDIIRIGERAYCEQMDAPKAMANKAWTQHEHYELVTGHIIIWAQHNNTLIVYVVSPIAGDAPETIYHGTSLCDAEKAMQDTVSDRLTGTWARCESVLDGLI